MTACADNAGVCGKKHPVCLQLVLLLLQCLGSALQCINWACMWTASYKSKANAKWGTGALNAVS